MEVPENSRSKGIRTPVTLQLLVLFLHTVRCDKIVPSDIVDYPRTCNLTKLMCNESRLLEEDKIIILNIANEMRNRVAEGSFIYLNLRHDPVSNMNKLSWNQTLEKKAASIVSLCPETSPSYISQGTSILPGMDGMDYIKINKSFDLSTYKPNAEMPGCEISTITYKEKLTLCAPQKIKERLIGYLTEGGLSTEARKYDMRDFWIINRYGEPRLTFRRHGSTDIGCSYMIRTGKTDYFAYLTCIHCAFNGSLPIIGHPGDECGENFQDFDQKYENLCSGLKNEYENIKADPNYVTCETAEENMTNSTVSPMPPKDDSTKPFCLPGANGNVTAPQCQTPSTITKEPMPPKDNSTKPLCLPGANGNVTAPQCQTPSTITKKPIINKNATCTIEFSNLTRSWQNVTTKTETKSTTCRKTTRTNSTKSLPATTISITAKKLEGTNTSSTAVSSATRNVTSPAQLPNSTIASNATTNITTTITKMETKSTTCRKTIATAAEPTTTTPSSGTTPHSSTSTCRKTTKSLTIAYTAPRNISSYSTSENGILTSNLRQDTPITSTYSTIGNITSTLWNRTSVLSITSAPAETTSITSKIISIPSTIKNITSPQSNATLNLDVTKIPSLFSTVRNASEDIGTTHFIYENLSSSLSSTSPSSSTPKISPTFSTTKSIGSSATQITKLLPITLTASKIFSTHSTSEDIKPTLGTTISATDEDRENEINMDIEYENVTMRSNSSSAKTFTITPQPTLAKTSDTVLSKFITKIVSARTTNMQNISSILSKELVYDVTKDESTTQVLPLTKSNATLENITATSAKNKILNFTSTFTKATSITTKSYYSIIESIATKFSTKIAKLQTRCRKTSPTTTLKRTDPVSNAIKSTHSTVKNTMTKASKATVTFSTEKLKPETKSQGISSISTSKQTIPISETTKSTYTIIKNITTNGSNAKTIRTTEEFKPATKIQKTSSTSTLEKTTTIFNITKLIPSIIKNITAKVLNASTMFSTEKLKPETKYQKTSSTLTSTEITQSFKTTKSTPLSTIKSIASKVLNTTTTFSMKMVNLTSKCRKTSPPSTYLSNTTTTFSTKMVKLASKCRKTSPPSTYPSNITTTFSTKMVKLTSKCRKTSPTSTYLSNTTTTFSTKIVKLASKCRKTSPTSTLKSTSPTFITTTSTYPSIRNITTILNIITTFSTKKVEPETVYQRKSSMLTTRGISLLLNITKSTNFSTSLSKDINTPPTENSKTAQTQMKTGTSGFFTNKSTTIAIPTKPEKSTTTVIYSSPIKTTKSLVLDKTVTQPTNATLYNTTSGASESIRTKDIKKSTSKVTQSNATILQPVTVSPISKKLTIITKLPKLPENTPGSSEQNEMISNETIFKPMTQKPSTVISIIFSSGKNHAKSTLKTSADILPSTTHKSTGIFIEPLSESTTGTGIPLATNRTQSVSTTNIPSSILFKSASVTEILSSTTYKSTSIFIEPQSESTTRVIPCVTSTQSATPTNITLSSILLKSSSSDEKTTLQITTPKSTEETVVEITHSTLPSTTSPRCTSTSKVELEITDSTPLCDPCKTAGEVKEITTSTKSKDIESSTAFTSSPSTLISSPPETSTRGASQTDPDIPDFSKPNNNKQQPCVCINWLVIGLIFTVAFVFAWCLQCWQRILLF